MTVYALGEDRPHFGADCWIAENATVIGRVRAGARVSIWFNAVLRGDNDPIHIGDDTNIQDGAVLHTDEGVPLALGRGVTIGHMAMLHGCTVGDYSLIGINAVLLNHCKIGEFCVIGAKTLIPEGKVIPPRSLVVGTPGRIIRTLTDEEVERLKQSADTYIEHAREYRQALRALPPSVV
ncbi:MAG: gamma carbonic anhydrase family protein [Rhodocyclaceae bacterium]|nr:gamma carbonic anhydrase family protein [Rhodocyclaceae bacterium]MBQ7626352.1 gamma carbonic anhydrase family protein [Rhodocyclaceae bacterium]